MPWSTLRDDPERPELRHGQEGDLSRIRDLDGPVSRRDSFVIYALETTGLYPKHDEFIQIAAVRFEGGG